MRRDRRGRFLSPGPAGARGGGRARGRPSRGVERAREDGAEEPGAGRAPAMGHCRLCHGRFSSRSLRSISGCVLGDSAEKPAPRERVFIRDFQCLLGVTVRQDAALSPFICKNCLSQFYQCHGLLTSFLQRVNASPAALRQPRAPASAQPLAGPEEAACMASHMSPSTQGLRGLVGWVHGHAAGCGALPSLQQTLSSGYHGALQAVWGCAQGHCYTMDTGTSCGALLLDSSLSIKWAWDKELAPQPTQHRGTSPTGAAPQPSPGRPTLAARVTETETQPRTDTAQLPSAGNPVGPGPGPPPQPNLPLRGNSGQLGETQAPPSASDDRVKDEFSDLSEGGFPSEDENDRKHVPSSDESFEPYPEKRLSTKKSESKDAKKEEPKLRKKPGPKPGWKSKLRCEREELPTIYKCPHQGCTAVYRGADGMKKHIKEYHEEVRERPCPYPGCNKVFMIDRYLQRHLKLIHTEVRNYICDECGQTFKQRKHLLVHQMRHSGAKPLQCEVCGFQCRQRASLKYHMTKHKAETELDFACDQCGRRFEKAHNLNVHMSMVHPLTQAQDKAPPGPGVVKPEPT
ncbi:zinc finger protein 276 isoform X1 [Sorex araneus]|uniref:zinc finger protein 276 isoform X1 n=2 Tax=Sorex araneus TaxID=42254 RepID=UPI002433DC26|nr:zinc finger protein 276 isoform X1 [Sorex araneus]